MTVLARRKFARLLIAASTAVALRSLANGHDLLIPLYLRLVRRTGWEEMMGRNQCIVGDLYVTQTGFPRSDLGRRLCSALELPWRGNGNEISSIPAGRYGGSIRTDGPHGWRIELEGTGLRSHVQVHVGNSPEDTVGCILVGLGDSTDAQCRIAGSREAIQLIRTEYGNDSARTVELLIQSV